MRIGISCVICLLTSTVYASSGTEGAAFLDIPVGAGPAAMGSAYTALANDAYAPIYNPAGLGFLPSAQFSGQHLSYLDSLHYEYLSFAVPLRSGSALGGSVQYLGSGSVDGFDKDGNSIGTITSYYASYNLAYGHAVNDKLSLGLTTKVIDAKLVNAKANAYAVDLGSLYKLNHLLNLAASLTNLGSKLTFLNDGDPLPMAVHLAASYQPDAHFLLTGEGIYPKTGLASFHAGAEWRPVQMLALRTGYRTDTVKGLSALAGYSLGAGVIAWGTELAYAWLPYGDLGNTHYFSLLMKFGESEEGKRNLIQYQHIKLHRSVSTSPYVTEPDDQELMELLGERKDPVTGQLPGVPSAQ